LAKKNKNSAILLVGLIALAFLGVNYTQENPAIVELNPSAQQSAEQSTTPKGAKSDDALLKKLFDAQQSDVQVRGRGTVIALLADDLKGSRHQRFIVKLASGQTVLVVHNIDLAARINTLQKGDVVEFFGEYEWTPKGGLVHWTHKDPRGKHIAGYILHNQEIYH
jgi:hypothetical protein